MDEASSQPGINNAPATTTAAVSPVESGWDEYYREASRRRRRNGAGHQQLHNEKRRRRIRERFAIALSLLLVGAMTSVFYLVLR